MSFNGCVAAKPRPRAPSVTRPSKPPDHAPLASASPSGWFPYARAEGPGAPIDLVNRVKSILFDRIDDFAACTTSDHTGSMSAMLDLRPGSRPHVRVGGIGHKPTEDCIATTLATLPFDTLPLHAELQGEVECNLSIGPLGPLRITPDAWRHRIEVTQTEARVDGRTIAIDRVIEEPLPTRDTTVVIADPLVDGGRLARVLDWTSQAPVVMLAVKADGGAPVFVALAPDDRVGPLTANRISLYVDDGVLNACVGAHRSQAKLVDARRVKEAMVTAVGACEACDRTMEIAVDQRLLAKELVGASSAVRRFGAEPVIASTPRCKL